MLFNFSNSNEYYNPIILTSLVGKCDDVMGR